jgi:SAM-dependent methyltransferase
MRLVVEQPQLRRLPRGSALMQARHLAFARELEAIVNQLSLRGTERVLDAPCGDGFFCAVLARRLRPHGIVMGIDLSPAMVAWGDLQPWHIARYRNAKRRVADVRQLPFKSAAFDVVWCAHSLISLDDPAAAFHEFHRVLRPGGLLAVLESDAWHEVLLPWPADLELAIWQAARAERQARGRDANRLHPVRGLMRLLGSAGFRLHRRTTYAIDRVAPLNADERRFLRCYLEDIRTRAHVHLTARQAALLDQLSDPHRPGSLFRDAQLEMTCLDTLWLAQRK